MSLSVKNFVRGGQTTLHSVRMFSQIAIRLLVLVAALFFCLTLYITLNKTSEIDKKILEGQLSAYASLYTPLGDVKNITVMKTSIHPEKYLKLKRVKIANQKLKVNLAIALTQSAIAAIIFFIISIWALSYRSRAMLETKKVRGAEIKPLKILNKEIRAHNKKVLKDMPGTPTISLAGLTLPIEAETQHILITGAPGSGKTIATSEILDQVRHKGQKAIVFDIEGSFIPHYYREGKDIILNPLDERSPRWNLWKDFTHTSHFDDMASMIVSGGENSIDDFWLKAARVMLSVSASQYPSINPTPTMQDFLEHLFASNKDDVDKLLHGTMAASMLGKEKDLEKSTQSILLTLVTYCSSLLYIKDNPKEKPFSIREWVQNDNTDSWIFISCKEEYIASLSPILSMWMDCALSSFLTLPEDYSRRFWLYLDEMSSLSKQSKLIDFLERGRKRGGCFVGTIQDPSQLSSIYGRNGGDTLRALIGTNIFFQTNSFSSAQMAANILGKQEFIEAKEGFSIGSHEMRDGINISHGKQSEYLISPQEIMNLKKKEAYIRISGGWPVTKLVLERKIRSARHDALILRDESEISHKFGSNKKNELVGLGDF